MNQPTIKPKHQPRKSIKPISIDIVRHDINIWLEHYLEQTIEKARSIDESYAQLWATISKVILSGGKRLRPFLFLCSYTGLGGNDYIQATEIAAAHELFHQCLLIHDDVIDRDNIRHGQPNITGYAMQRFHKLGKDANHYASSEAILAGDLLLSAAYQLINERITNQMHNQLIASNIHQAMFEVAAGELLDIEAAIRPLNQSKPLEVGNYKTASYSFSLPLMNGGILAGAGANDRNLLKLLGYNLGIAYQLQDDILGVFGDDKKTGKSISSDLSEGKHTLLIKLALEKSTVSERQRIQRSLGNKDITKEAVEEIKKILLSTGAYDKTKNIIDIYTKNALKLLNEMSFAPLVKNQLRDTIDQLVERNS